MLKNSVAWLNTFLMDSMRSLEGAVTIFWLREEDCLIEAMRSFKYDSISSLSKELCRMSRIRSYNVSVLWAAASTSMLNASRM